MLGDRFNCKEFQRVVLIAMGIHFSHDIIPSPGAVQTTLAGTSVGSKLRNVMAYYVLCCLQRGTLN